MFRVMRMQWRDVLFASWPMDPRAIAGKLPSGLKPDLHEGKAWMSLVAFENKDMRARGAPRWAGVDLPELNLRTYVTHDKGPGVLFMSLDAEGWFSVVGARVLFQLPYFYAKISRESKDGDHRFESRRRHPGGGDARFCVRFAPEGERKQSTPGSLDAFLLERYALYTRTPLGLARLEVEHAPWAVQGASVQITKNTVMEAAGLPHPEGDPVCHYAAGLDVVVSSLAKSSTIPYLKKGA